LELASGPHDRLLALGSLTTFPNPLADEEHASPLATIPALARKLEWRRQSLVDRRPPSAKERPKI
jgi:hypothetical protein